MQRCDRCAVIGRRPLASACYHLGSSFDARKPQASKAYTRCEDQAGKWWPRRQRQPKYSCRSLEFRRCSPSRPGPT